MSCQHPKFPSLAWYIPREVEKGSLKGCHLSLVLSSEGSHFLKGSHILGWGHGSMDSRACSVGRIKSGLDPATIWSLCTVERDPPTLRLDRARSIMGEAWESLQL